MAVDWPATLPQYVDQTTFGETIQDPVIRTDMEGGPKKARLRYTAVPEQYTISMILTSSQRTAFLTFYKSTLNYGVDEFVWYHPLDSGSPRTERYCRFTGPYTISSQDTYFNMSINMEVLP